MSENDKTATTAPADTDMTDQQPQGKRVQVSLPGPLLEALEANLDFHNNRSEYIREAIRCRLSRTDPTNSDD
jgi:metal-responsive CopG/Arc/MetJ family transcriptional regulator